MTSLKKKVIVRDRHKNHLQKPFDKFNALTLTAENVSEIDLRKYQKTELLKNRDDELIDLIDEEDADRIDSEVDSSLKQNEGITEALVKIRNYYQNRKLKKN